MAIWRGAGHAGWTPDFRTKAHMTKFSDLKLDPKVLKAISEAGYDSPTPIQAGAIPPALEGRDVLGIAQTGTGKTASFTLPMITLLGRGRARARMPRSLVLAPTRELAAQVAENFDVYAKHTKLTKALLIGGVSFAEQDKLIDRGVDVLIATPGRLLDHFERGKLLLTGVQIMVVDEADRMLDMGFIPDIERIFQLTPFTRQTLFFSATMAPEIERITNTFLHSPERIEVARQATTSETITQRLVEITPTRKDQSAKQKRELLRALIDSEGEALNNAIIFCNRKTDVDIVAKSLKVHGYDAAPIHGDLDQSQRMKTLDDFRDGRLRFLIASDVAARGLDIPAVSHVFNFDLPSHAEDYVHRIGRTGRAGRLGTAISISTPMDEKYLSAIESLVKQTLPRTSIPDNFHLSAAAQDAPRQANGRHERKGKERERGRRGRSRDRDHEHEHVAAMAPIADVAPVAEAPAPRDERPADQPRHEQVRNDQGRQDQGRHEQNRNEQGRQDQSRNEQGRHEQGRDNARSEQNRGRGREDRRDNRDNREDRRETRGEHRHERGERGRDNRRDDRNPVLGMGDHVPDFMLRSFRPSILLSESSDHTSEAPARSEKVEIIPIKTPAATPRAAAPAAPQAADRPTTEAAASPAASAEPIAPVAATAPVSEATAAPTTATPAEVVAEPAAPVKAPRKRAPRKPAKAAAAPAESPSAAEAETAALAAAEPAEAPVAEAKPARKPRSRAKKAEPVAAATDAAPEAAAVDVPAKPVRKRAPRKTAAAKAAEAEAEAAAAVDPTASEA
ncbi:ATP-dependent RNA helicase RhlE [Paracoccus aminophilus JCM 7686]|uniref:DEAD-box ATP-dependent RNA helicase RhpA n=1 Tax=Paracoccus aminophilus JCM 7686 TaxID=1367847 RepID=S5Y9Y5_PARAH|nr:ATP-dependent RNA helicase RhlE [Paracoccus aminophilus JCM 7686]